MPTIKNKIVLLGDGGWGTTLALLLNQKGYAVTLWGAFEDYVDYLNKKRVNTRFLPGIKIPKNITITHDLNNALSEKRIIVFATPSQHTRAVLKKVKSAGYPHEAVYLSVTKGIEVSSLKRISEIIHEELGPVKIAVLSGPTIAHEVTQKIPTTAVIASRNKSTACFLQDIFMTERFRVYTTEDVVGVELGGSLKNVIAIACGICDGLGFGTNTKAALLSRGLAEISRLGQSMGAKLNTFFGVSGLGDLVTTCISPYSRNRFVGEQIGKGKTLTEITRSMQMVAEGVATTKSAYQLSLKQKIETPIIKEVYSVLYKEKPPQKAVRDLMTRAKKRE